MNKQGYEKVEARLTKIADSLWQHSENAAYHANNCMEPREVRLQVMLTKISSTLVGLTRYIDKTIEELDRLENLVDKRSDPM